MSDAHELLDDLEGTGRQLREKIPGVYSRLRQDGGRRDGRRRLASCRVQAGHGCAWTTSVTRASVLP